MILYDARRRETLSSFLRKDASAWGTAAKGVGKILSIPYKALVGFTKLPKFITIPVGGALTLEGLRLKPVRAYFNARMQDLGHDIGTNVTSGAVKASKPAIDQLKDDISSISKVDPDAQKGRLKAVNQFFDNLKTKSNQLGEGLGVGIARSVSPVVTSLGLTGLGAGGGGIAAHYLAKRITNNRLLRTLITLAGAGAGGVLANIASQKYVVPALYKTEKRKADKAEADRKDQEISTVVSGSINKQLHPKEQNKGTKSESGRK